MYRQRPFGFFHSANPWREIGQLQHEMNRIFNSVGSLSHSRVAPGYPAINVWANNEGLAVTAELPGVNPADIDISVVGKTFTLTGSRQPDELKDGETYHRRERRFGKFTRTFELPFKVETDKIEAVFDKGVLHVSLPRAEEEKPKKIAVKSAN